MDYAKQLLTNHVETLKRELNSIDDPTGLEAWYTRIKERVHSLESALARLDDEAPAQESSPASKPRWPKSFAIEGEIGEQCWVGQAVQCRADTAWTITYRQDEFRWYGSEDEIKAEIRLRAPEAKFGATNE